MWRTMQGGMQRRQPSVCKQPVHSEKQRPQSEASRRSILFSRSRSALVLVLSILALYKATHKLRTNLNFPAKAELEKENPQYSKHVVVFTLHPKYNRASVEPTQRRILLERDLRRLGNNNAAAVDGVKKLTVVLPVRGNVYPDGLYYVAMHFGNPGKRYYLDVDTGSDLTWLQCDAPCRSCGKGPNGLYDPKKARMVDCRHALCAPVQRGGAYQCEDNGRRWTQCDYDREFADGSSTMGILMEDLVSLFLLNGSRTHTRVTIGCGYDQRGTLAKSPALTDGVMGLSSSKVAVPSQLAQRGVLSHVIGHCVPGGTVDTGGFLFFGDALVPSSGMTWVPMTGRPHKEGYQARLCSIRYGAEELRDKRGVIGSVTFDSGTSFTYLVPAAYTALLAAVQGLAERSGLMRTQTDTTLPFCWGGPSPFESATNVHQYFKSISLDFCGSKILELYPEGYLIVSKQGNVCLGILDVSIASLEVTNIIGDISMRGYLIVYNNVQEQIGWVRKNCHNQPSRPTA